MVTFRTICWSLGGRREETQFFPSVEPMLLPRFCGVRGSHRAGNSCVFSHACPAGQPGTCSRGAFGATGTEISIWFDYGSFIASYECLIDDVARFESSIEVLSNTQRLQVRYDTPYIRNLPAGVTFQETVGSENRVTEYGPYYQDPFNAELVAFTTRS